MMVLYSEFIREEKKAKPHMYDHFIRLATKWDITDNKKQHNRKPLQSRVPVLPLSREELEYLDIPETELVSTMYHHVLNPSANDKAGSQ